MPQRLLKAIMFVCSTVLAFTSTLEGATSKPVAVRWWGQGMVSIETYWNLTVVLDPYDTKRTGYADPGVSADVILVTHEHFDHNNIKLVRGKSAVVHGLGDKGDVRVVDVILDRRANVAKPTITNACEAQNPSPHSVRIRSIASSHDRVSGRKRGHNAMFVIEVNGVRVLHCGDLGQPRLTEAQLEAIGDIDVVLIPVGGIYTVDGRQAVAIVYPFMSSACRSCLPMHESNGITTYALSTSPNCCLATSTV